MSLEAPMQHISSPDLSSPPSGSPPPTSDQLQPSHDPPALQIDHSAHHAPLHPARSGANKDGQVAKRRKKEVNGSLKTSSGQDDKPKRQRAPKGMGVRALAKKAREEAALAQRLQQQQKASITLAGPGPSSDGVGKAKQPAQDFSTPHNGLSAPPTSAIPAPSNQFLPPSKHEAIQDLVPPPNHHHQPSTPPPPSLQQPPPHQHHHQSQSYMRPSSGQNYDPVRSSTIPSHRPTSPMNHAVVSSTPPKVGTPSLNATRSPSISSLIDPPDSFRSQSNANSYTPKTDDPQTSYFSHDVKRPRLSPPPAISGLAVPQTKSTGSELRTGTPSAEVPARVAPSVPSQALSTQSKKQTPSISKGPSPGSHSPKPPTRKEAAPLPSTGSGLLSGSMFGAGADDGDLGPEKKAPTVILDVPLTGENQYVNFTRLAEEKYGFDALHPRLAAQRERLARVAAAGAALERAKKEGGSGMSADEMSVDLSNDEGDNSNVEMGGVVGSKSGEDAEKPARKKRILKEDMYDVEDDFIDDTEQAWEEQAAVSMDGFFVYSGPLVPEGEEAKVERTESAPKRGRGGGRGSRGGGTGRGGRGGANAANKDSKEPREVKKRVRRSKEQIERDNRELEEKKLLKQKDKLTLLASKPTATTVPSQMRQLQSPAQQMTV